jgi:biotin transporter BioY
MRWTHAFLAPFLESWASEGVVPFFFGGGPMTHLNLPPFGFLMDFLTGGFLTGGMVPVDLVQTRGGPRKKRVEML